MTGLFQSTLGEIRIGDRDGIAIFNGLTGNLAEDQIIAGHFSDDERRAALGLAKV